MPSTATLIENWDGLAVLSRFDRPTGSWIFICLHDNTLGPSTGGTRISSYPEPAAALEDAMRLAEGMTHKWAAVGAPFGGGKAVVAVTRPLAGTERREFLLRYAALVDSLRGGFLTGEDLGTSSDDMTVMAERTRYIHGFDSAGRKIDPSPYTAHGVLRGIEAAAATMLGNGGLGDVSVLVEGVGHVGAHLAELLAAAGADLLVCDIDQARAEEIAGRLGGRTVAPDELAATTCDVYAPCAVGATLNRDSIPRLDCRIVAGSANNQLRELADAERLHQRGIVYVPDFIINAGGALSFAELDRGVSEPAALRARVDEIGPTVREILREARDRGETTLRAAQRRVERNLAAARAGRGDG